VDDAELAASLVSDAGTLAARMLAEGLTTHHKTSISDVVSAADHAAEELIASHLAAERPDDGVVGEEGTSRSGERTWYIDPVDGTYNFLSGLPVWCSAVALCAADEIVLGAVYQQTTDELWLGGPDRPLTLNGSRVPPLVDRALTQVSIATYLHPTTLPDASRREPMLRVIEQAATLRMLGSGSVELAAVAAGRLGCALQYDPAPWDQLPGAALVLGAGGAAESVRAHGHRWHITGNRRSVEEIATILSAR
jgi:fructose-1,6-bisphosphatase/inositol monophosphatase family enzyme